jgi:hypothetical protein
MKEISFILLIALLACSAQAQDFDFASYRPSSIPNIIKEHEPTFFRNGKVLDAYFSTQIFKYRINTAFTRELREIRPDKLKFIQKWAKALGQSPEIVELYKYEFLVKQAGRDFWIPVQDRLLPSMGNELKVGQQFKLYIVLAGTVKDQWVFLATEFEAK